MKEYVNMKLNWVELNLPYNKQEYYEPLPQPKLDVEIKEKFGMTYKKAYSEVNNLLNKICNINRDYKSLSDPLLLEQYPQLIPLIELYNTAINLCDKIWNYYCETPTYIEWHNNENIRQAEYNLDQKQNGKSFSARKLNTAGTLVELNDGRIELIGSVNESGGGCNDCPVIRDEDIIVRYAIVSGLFELINTVPTKEVQNDSIE